MDHVIGGVGVHLAVLKCVPVNTALSRTYIWTPRSTFYNVRKLSYTLKLPWTMTMALLVLVYIWQFWNMFQSTQHGQKHTSIHQDLPSIMPGSWITPWSGPGLCWWHCFWCWCSSGSSDTFSGQLSIVKNIYLDTKINLLSCQGAELHQEVALDHVVGVGVHLVVLKPVPVNSSRSKRYIWTPRSTFFIKYSLFWCHRLQDLKHRPGQNQGLCQGASFSNRGSHTLGSLCKKKLELYG